jgi:hypothetical protein
MSRTNSAVRLKLRRECIRRHVARTRHAYDARRQQFANSVFMRTVVDE